MIGVDALVVLALLACAAGALVDPRSWSLPAVACLALPAAAAVAAVWLVAALLLRHWKGGAAVALSLLAAAPQVVTVVPMGLGAPEAEAVDGEPHGTFTVMTFNVNGTGKWLHNHLRKPNPLISYVLQTNPDIVIFQEASLGGVDYDNIPAINVILDSLNAAYPYREHGYHDVIIMSRYPYKRLTFDNIDPDWINPDRPTELNFDLEGYDVMLPQGRPLRVIGFHLQAFGLKLEDKNFYVEMTKGNTEPRQSMSRFKNNLIDKLRNSFEAQATEAELIRQIVDASPRDLIVCGDMNNVPPSWPYRTLRGGDLHDVFVELGRGYMATYNKHRMFFHIDHMFYRGNIRPVSFERGDAVTSDHYPLIATFEY